MSTRNESRNQSIMRLFADRHSYGEIADGLGLSRSTVAGVIHRNRLSQPKTEMSRGGCVGRACAILDRTYPSVAAAGSGEGVSRHTIANWIKIGHRKARYLS